MQRTKTWLCAGALALALGAASTTQSAAAVVTLDETVDLNSAATGSLFYRFEGSDFPAFNISLSEGDVLDFTVSFLPGQAVTLPFLTRFTIVFDPIGGIGFHGSNSVANGPGQTLSLLDPLGSPIATFTTDTIGRGAFFTEFDLPDLDGLGTPVTFSGFRAIIPLSDYTLDGVTTRSFNNALVIIQGSAGPVPEPSAWALMISGFALVGLALRRRPRATVARRGRGCDNSALWRL